MKEFDVILEECIDQMTRGASTLDQCLARYPEHAARLRPLLRAAVRVEAGRSVAPSADFKKRTRLQLDAHMRAHPRSRSQIHPFWRISIRMAALVLVFFITGTAFAQSALPGDRLYGWKLSSENVWRAVSFDRLGADLGIAERRVDEMVAVSGDEMRLIYALEGYKVVLSRFEHENELDQQRIVPVLQSQRDSLAQAGLLIPELDNYFLSDSQVDNSNTVPLPSTEVAPNPPDSLSTPQPPPH